MNVALITSCSGVNFGEQPAKTVAIKSRMFLKEAIEGNARVWRVCLHWLIALK
tara:strand:- start:880 stop:1038 length:159 start_codon:yes stop_codon:yes gene_type:complete